MARGATGHRMRKLKPRCKPSPTKSWRESNEPERSNATKPPSCDARCVIREHATQRSGESRIMFHFSRLCVFGVNQNMKVSIIGGGGRVGSCAAFALQCGGIVSEIQLLDANQAMAEGEALDLLHGSAFTADQRIYA